jgi:hypothetical protein
MKKLSVFTLLLCVTMVYACVDEMVYVKTPNLFKVKDDGTNRVKIKDAGWGEFYHQPDVNHNGDMVAYLAGGNPYVERGFIWTMKIDGTDAKRITEFSLNSNPRWFPDNRPALAYFGRCTGLTTAICEVSTEQDPGTAIGVKICDTNNRDNGGFDFNQPQSGPLQIIFSRREGDGSYKLYQRDHSCSGTDTKIRPFLPPPHIGNPAALSETLPVVSFSQHLLASVVEWPNVLGIRVRGIDENGVIGPPATFQFEDIQEITGISFADGDDKIFFSVKIDSMTYELYRVELKDFIGSLIDWISDPPATLQFPPPVASKTRINVPSGRNSWPDGVKRSGF